MIALTAFMLAFPIIIDVSALTLDKPSPILPSSAIANVTNLHYIHKCDMREYGRDLDSRSCNEALNQIDIFSTTEQTYGPRFTGPFDVKLPKRYISSNGRCIIEPSLIRGEISARASLQEIASAAGYVIDQCAATTPSQGGRVRNIGGDNNLQVVVAKYEAQVQCSGTVAPSLFSSCQNIVDTMPASKDFTTWGPMSDPLAAEKLPLTYYSLDRKCKMSIRTDGSTDTFARYQFWSSAVVLTGVCVRGGQMGARYDLGMSDHLSMEIGPT